MDNIASCRRIQYFDTLRQYTIFYIGWTGYSPCQLQFSPVLQLSLHAIFCQLIFSLYCLELGVFHSRKDMSRHLKSVAILPDREKLCGWIPHMLFRLALQVLCLFPQGLKRSLLSLANLAVSSYKLKVTRPFSGIFIPHWRSVWRRCYANQNGLHTVSV